MIYASPFPTFSTPVLNQLAASLWISLVSTFKITDTLGLMMLEQLAFSHWAANELARKQSRDLAAGAESDSPAMLRLSRERRAECRLQAQLARQLNQHLRTLASADAETSKANNETILIPTKIGTPANTQQQTTTEISKLVNRTASSGSICQEPLPRTAQVGVAAT